MHWYDAKTVLAQATSVLGTDFATRFRELKQSLGAPWGQDQRLAMASGIVAAKALRT
jgi:hypothetical protein